MLHMMCVSPLRRCVLFVEVHREFVVLPAMMAVQSFVIRMVTSFVGDEQFHPIRTHWLGAVRIWRDCHHYPPPAILVTVTAGEARLRHT